MIFMMRSDIIFTAGSNYVIASRSYGHVSIMISDRVSSWVSLWKLFWGDTIGDEGQEQHPLLLSLFIFIKRIHIINGRCEYGQDVSIIPPRLLRIMTRSNKRPPSLLAILSIQKRCPRNEERLEWKVPQNSPLQSLFISNKLQPVYKQICREGRFIHGLLLLSSK